MDKNILIVEDEPTTQSVLRMLVVSLGFRARVARDGAQALDALAESPVDLVLMDCQLPVLDGFETARRIRRRENDGRRVPIVAVTAFAGEERRCRDAGMDDFLVKPFRAEDLRSKLALHLDPSSRGAAAQRTARQDDDGVLDAEILSELVRVTDTYPGFIEKLVRNFLGERLTRCRQLWAALEAGNGAELGRLAHRLAGSAGSVGALGLAGLSRQLENAAEARELTAGGERLRALEAEYDRVEGALLRWLGEL